MNLNFHGIGESTVDLNDIIVCGRIPGGDATFWKVEYDPIIRPLKLNVDWAIGIELTINEKRFYIINVYLPYEKPDNESDLLNILAWVAAVVDELDSCCV